MSRAHRIDVLQAHSTRSVAMACLLLGGVALRCSAQPGNQPTQSPAVAFPVASAAPISSVASPAASPAPPPPAVPHASGSAPAPAASVAPAPALPMPALPQGADKERFTLAASVCAVAIKRVRGKTLVGCRGCPPFDSTEGKPDGTVVTDPEPFFELQAVYKGSFTQAGARQAALVFEGCESHAENYGGTMLAGHGPDGWKKLTYASAIHPKECKTFAREDGRDMLVCLYRDAHQTTGTDTVFAYDFGPGPQTYQNILMTSDNSAGACMGIPPDGLSRTGVDSFGLRDVTGDGKLDLVIQAHQAHVAYSHALDDKVRKLCAAALRAHPDELPVPPRAMLMPPDRRVTLEFSHDGTRFIATPATAKKAKDWLDTSP